MQISDGRTIASIKEEFHKKFPFLKLEFYNKSHGVGEGSLSQSLLDETQTIGEIRTKHTVGDLSINGHLKVTSLEHFFANDYGLNVQVFRKSGGIWLQTTTTDEWTLTEQERKGEQFRN